MRITVSLPRLLAFLTIGLFSLIGIIALFKEPAPKVDPTPSGQTPLVIELDQQPPIITPALAPPTPTLAPPPSIVAPAVSDKETTPTPAKSAEDLPDANRIEELFIIGDHKLPIVETITYKSHVPWQKGRPAWLSDYAAHYTTSRHFIARSLNGKPDYLKQELAEGDRFNVLRQDKNFEFYLVVDTSRCRMWFYYIDLDAKKKVLLKTYQVGLGRLDASKTSGLLTPMGKYTLGSRVAIYKPKMMGTYQGKNTEMITIFGSRWIPFDKEVAETTAPAKGFGLHGTPWTAGPKGELVDDTSSLGKYESDGCIRLSTPDIDEVFAIVISRPTTIEIVRDFNESSLTAISSN